MGKEYLGEFEELVLTMVGVLQDDAYGAAISDEIGTRLKREVNLSAVHVTLYRLEDKGYLESKLSESTNERGGKRKRLFYLTPAATRALNELASLREQLRYQIPKQALRLKEE